MIGRNELCWCGSKKKWKKCHFPKEGPSESAALAMRYMRQYKIPLKTPQQIEGIRKACKLSAQILDAACKMAKPGVTTREIDAYVRRLHDEAGAVPAPLGYGSPPYPFGICTSLNEVICHGFPDDVPLKEGDILNIDVSAILAGYFGDCSKMVVLEPVSVDRKLVVEVANECLERSIRLLKPGLMLYAIGDAIEECAAEHGCSVVNQFVGHGVGLAFHEPPQVPHHRNQVSIPLAPGMTFTIEPMINAGVREAVIDPDNGWIARTQDGLPSAQAEHTVLITDTGYEVLTLNS